MLVYQIGNWWFVSYTKHQRHESSLLTAPTDAASAAHMFTVMALDLDSFFAVFFNTGEDTGKTRKNDDTPKGV